MSSAYPMNSAARTTDVPHSRTLLSTRVSGLLLQVRCQNPHGAKHSPAGWQVT